METQSKDKVYVIGHKNPDTDSICSSICYAYLKRQITGDDYVPMRAGRNQICIKCIFRGCAGIYGKCLHTGKRRGIPPYRWR